MSWNCPNCGTVYATLPQDKMCPREDCFPSYLEEKKDQTDFKTMEGLCVLVCDVSGSMDDAAFPPLPNTKRTLVVSAIDLAIRELESMNKAENAYIAIVAFGEKAGLIKDRTSAPFIKSIRQINAEFPGKGDLERYLDKMIEGDLCAVGREQTNISAGLDLAFDLYDAAARPGGSLRQFGFDGSIEIMSHDLYSSEGVMISVPNIRVMIYSDGEHNPGNGNPLRNRFASLSPSVLMTAFIGDEKKDETRKGAEQMSAIATTCPQHGHSGYFLINSIDRHHRLRNIFRMASGYSGFCPQCLGRPVSERMSRATSE